MDHKNANLLLWIIAGVSVLLMLVSTPSKKTLKQSQSQLATINREIKTSKQEKVTAGVLKSNQNVNLKQLESDAQSKLTEGVSLAMGGIHSADDLNNNKAKLTQDLGWANAKKLVKTTQTINGHKYIAERNDSTTVTFGEASDYTSVPVIINSNYTDNDGTQKYMQITGRYNLNKQKLSNVSVTQMLKKTPTQASKGD